MIGSKTAFSMLLGVVALAFAATPAQAGLDFTDTAQVGGSTIDGGGLDTVNVNGMTASFFSPTGANNSIAMVNGFHGGGADLVTFSGNANGGAATRIVQLDFSYNGLFNQVIAASYNTASGDDLYAMVIEFGAISIGGGDSVTLTNISFSEAGSPAFNQYLIARSITAADAGNRIFLPVPSTGFGSVPLINRDQVDVVRLEFSFTGAATSVGINAVVNPEPGTLALFGLGLVGLVGVVRRRRRKGAIETAS